MHSCDTFCFGVMQKLNTAEWLRVHTERIGPVQVSKERCIEAEGIA